MTTTDPPEIDRCGLGRPHDTHQTSIGRCAGLTADAYEAKRLRDQRHEQAISVCPLWSPIRGCCCQEERGRVDHGPVATPTEVFG